MQGSQGIQGTQVPRALRIPRTSSFSPGSLKKQLLCLPKRVPGSTKLKNGSENFLIGSARTFLPSQTHKNPGLLNLRCSEFRGGKKVRADPIKNFSDPFFRLGDPRTRLGGQNMCFFKLPGKKLEVPGILGALGTWVPCIPWLPCIP